MFWKFSIPLAGMGFIFYFVLQLGIFLPFTILYEGFYYHFEKRGFFYLLLPPGFALILYVLGGWAALCATRTLIVKVYATPGWFYYVMGFFLCFGPLGYMVAEKPTDLLISLSYTAFTLLLFIAFCIWPGLTLLPYGWFLGWLPQIFL